MKKNIVGKNSVIDAINNKFPIKCLYLIKKPEFEVPSNIEVKIVDKLFINQLTKENHQGYLAEILDIQYHDLNVIFKDQPEKVLIIDHIQDTHNLGAIIRTANAAGITHMILPKDRAAKINDTVLKISSGGFINMKFILVNSLFSSIEKLKKNNFWIYSTALNESAIDINKVNFNYPLAVVLGSEDKGVSKTILKVSDQSIYIPLKGTVQSLNVSVAAGIVLFKI